MLESTKLAMNEIANIAFNMRQKPIGFDFVEQFKRIQTIAENTLVAEHDHEKAMLDILRNGGKS